jgi:hypothetical protein
MSLTLTRAATIVCLLACLMLPLRGADEVVGCIKSATGSAVVIRGNQTINATDGLHLQQHDVLRTGADGRLGAILQDGTRIGLGPGTELSITTFDYEPASGKLGMVLRLVRGIMAYFSGRVSKLAPGSVTVETPVGVVGLRGTYMAVSIGGTQ